MTADLLIPLAPALTALITATAVLIASRQSNSNNRDLKMIEIEEQKERSKRQEKREVYLELLRTYRMLVQYTAQISYTDLGQQFQTDQASVREIADRLNRLYPELEIAGSDEITDLYQRISTVAARCNRALFEETEKRFAPFDQRRVHPSPQQKEVIWREVSAEIRKVYDDVGMEQLYAHLRIQIRKELGFASPSESSVLGPEDATRLHERMLNLDQMRLRADQQS